MHTLQVDAHYTVLNGDWYYKNTCLTMCQDVYTEKWVTEWLPDENITNIQMDSDSSILKISCSWQTMKCLINAVKHNIIGKPIHSSVKLLRPWISMIKIGEILIKLCFSWGFLWSGLGVAPMRPQLEPSVTNDQPQWNLLRGAHGDLLSTVGNFASRFKVCRWNSFENIFTGRWFL